VFKPYQYIIILGHKFNDVRCDHKALYIGTENRGSKRGLEKVEISGIKYHFKLDKLMDFEEYMKIYNLDKNKLPEMAAKKLFFVEGV
jgi:hypothetical protein